MPKGHLVQTANLFDALFVFNSSFLFTKAQPTAVGILMEGTQNTRERERKSLFVGLWLLTKLTLAAHPQQGCQVQAWETLTGFSESSVADTGCWGREGPEDLHQAAHFNLCDINGQPG